MQASLRRFSSPELVIAEHPIAKLIESGSAIEWPWADPIELLEEIFNHLPCKENNVEVPCPGLLGAPWRPEETVTFNAAIRR